MVAPGTIIQPEIFLIFLGLEKGDLVKGIKYYIKTIFG